MLDEFDKHVQRKRMWPLHSSEHFTIYAIHHEDLRTHCHRFARSNELHGPAGFTRMEGRSCS